MTGRRGWPDTVPWNLAPEPDRHRGFHQKLLLHSRTLRASLDQWSEQQEKLLALALGPFPCVDSDTGTVECEHHVNIPPSMGALCDFNGSKSAVLPIRVSTEVHEACVSRPEPEQLCFAERLSGRVGADITEDALGKQNRGSVRTESGSCPFAESAAQGAGRSSELFSAEHVEGVINSTPGLKRPSGVTFAVSGHLGNFWSRATCCRKPKVLGDLERSAWFNAVCNCVIMANTVLLTVGAQAQADGRPPDEALESLEAAFFVFYAAELLLRMAVHRLGFFAGKESGWHMLDALLVLVSALEQLARLVSDGAGLNVSYLRAIRLLKILKVLRVLRVMRSLYELRLLLDSILGSAKSLLWSIMIMACTTFMFAICFVQAAARPALPGEEGLPSRAPWSSIPLAMTTLFMSATGGLDWQVLAEELRDDGLHYHLLFLLYIGIFLFVIENALTSMFVEQLLDNVSKDETFVVQDRLDKRIEYVEKIEELFNHMDKDGDGRVSLEDLCEHLHDQRMSAFAASLDIDESDLGTCFGIITSHGQNTIDADAFVVGCIKLRGQAKSVDIIDVCLTQSQIKKALGDLVEDHQRFAAFCDGQFQALMAGGQAHGTDDFTKDQRGILPRKRLSA